MSFCLASRRASWVSLISEEVGSDMVEERGREGQG